MQPTDRSTRHLERGLSLFGGRITVCATVAEARLALSSSSFEAAVLRVGEDDPEMLSDQVSFARECLSAKPLGCVSVLLAHEASEPLLRGAIAMGVQEILTEPFVFPRLLNAVHSAIQKTLRFRQRAKEPPSAFRPPHRGDERSKGRTHPTSAVNLIDCLSRFHARADLTHLESLLITQLLRGRSNEAIAEVLETSPRNVKHLVSIVLNKLNVERRFQMTALVFREG